MGPGFEIYFQGFRDGDLDANSISSFNVSEN